MKTQAILRAHCQADIVSDAFLVVHYMAPHGGKFHAEVALKKLSELRETLDAAEAELSDIVNPDAAEVAA